SFSAFIGGPSGPPFFSGDRPKSVPIGRRIERSRRYPMKRSLAIVASLLFTASLSASNLPQLLQKAKDQFRLAAYADALATLDSLEAESQKEGLEKEREALAPVIVFYRGACLATHDTPAEAQPQLKALLAFQPNAVLDPVLHPNKVRAPLINGRQSSEA